MPRGRPRKDGAAKSNGATLGFEAQLFLAADKLRKNLEPSDYKHVALGLIFLRHISIAFEARHAELLADDTLAAEDPDEYLAASLTRVQELRPGMDGAEYRREQAAGFGRRVEELAGRLPESRRRRKAPGMAPAGASRTGAMGSGRPGKDREAPSPHPQAEAASGASPGQGVRTDDPRTETLGQPRRKNER